MIKYPPTILIQETNFHNSWARAVRYVLRDRIQIVIGDTTEPKPIQDACVLFELTGTAIKQIENRELHPQFPFRHVDFYCDEFTREYLSQYIEKPELERFTYLYFDRLVNFGTLDQLSRLGRLLSEQIDTGVASNRDQSITWHPETDLGSTSPPCLQRIWVRYLGDNNVEVHMDWRSRDGYGAFQANIIALVDMLNREVIHPNGCEIVKIVDFSNSFHIYDRDEPAARNVKLVPACPQRN